ncbi:MAG: N-acetylneuraminate lyase [Clostridiales bacterium]|nr:N-acetylneuraminate lyase [Clostridiales bacterium]
MKNQKLCGILPALLTAFTDDGIDCAKVARHTKYLADAGVHGLYVGGSTGEMILMSEDERKTLLETVIESVGDRLTVIAHVGTTSTRGALELARHAEKAGADALSSVTPLYYKYSFREVKHYYERLAGETSLPVIIYNIPVLTGTTLSTDQLAEILSIPNVGGMKFTSSDFFQLERIRAMFPDKVFYNGSDEMLCSGLAAGADGGIGSTYNFMPKTILAIYNAFRANDAATALTYQAKANAAIATVLKYGVMPSAKMLLKLNGMDYGECREPFLPLGEEAIEALKALKVE